MAKEELIKYLKEAPDVKHKLVVAVKKFIKEMCTSLANV